MTGMTARVLEASEGAVWDDWLRTVEGGSARQTSIYARALELYGHRPEILVLEGGSSFVAGTLLGIKSAGPIGGPLVHASGGIALADPADARALGEILEAILDRSAELRASSVEVSLRIPRSVGERENPAAPELERTVRALGLEPSQPLETYYVDLAKTSDEALLENFGKNPRRHIRKAQRDGLTVESTVDPAVFAAFGETHRLMCRRKGLDPLPNGFPEEVLLPLVLAGHAELFVANFRDVARNYLFAGYTGLPLYLWGALADAAKDDDCPQTGQALHYAAMCRFRALGKPYYDFGGTPGPVPEPSHPNFSVWKFKFEFGVSYVPFLGFWKCDLRPASAAALGLARKVVALGRKVMR